jgi:dihydrofolate reductase
MITLIAAVGLRNELGKDNQLLWHLPNDFKHFKELTSGHHVIMGRKTFESLPGILPNRTHVVISRNPVWHKEGVLLVSSLDAAFGLVPAGEQAYVIGGGEIYRQALPHSDRIELTRVETQMEADTFFPEINPEEWKLVAEEAHPADERHAYAYRFQRFEKRTTAFDTE